MGKMMMMMRMRMRMTSNAICRIPYFQTKLRVDSLTTIFKTSWKQEYLTEAAPPGFSGAELANVVNEVGCSQQTWRLNQPKKWS
jgi:hypothetical protein